MMSKILRSMTTVQEASKSEELRAFLIVSNCPLEIIYRAMFGHCPVGQSCRCVFVLNVPISSLHVYILFIHITF